MGIYLVYEKYYAYFEFDFCFYILFYIIGLVILLIAFVDFIALIHFYLTCSKSNTYGSNT